jgi:hypothetical protein
VPFDVNIAYHFASPASPEKYMALAMNTMEVNDGVSWKTLDTNYASVGLTPEAESLLDWAKKKQAEEQSMAEMMERYPALKKARDNYELIWNIVKDEQHKDTL